MALAFIAGCTAPPGVAPVALEPEVEVVKPQPRTIVRRIEQPGVIEAYERTAIYTKVSGYVKKWLVDVGDTVKKDALLAELEVPELVQDLHQKQALVDQAQASVEQARQQQVIAEKSLQAAVDEIAEAKATVKRYSADVQLRDLQAKRMARLVESNAIQQELLDEANKSLGTSRAAEDAATASVLTKQAQQATAQAEVKKAAADVAVAQAKVKVAQADAARIAALVGYLKLTAPYDGIITDRNVSTGDLVRPATGDPSEGRAAEAQSSARATPLYLMARTDRVMFVVGIPEFDAAYVAPGVPALIRVQALGIELPLTVTRVSRRLESKSRTLQAQIDLPNADGKLMPGMYAIGVVKFERKAVLAVPSAAVLQAGEQSYCFLLEGGKAIRTPVLTGISDGSWVELRRKRTTDTALADPWTDITGQEPIIVGDLSELTDGAAVRTK